MTMQNPITDKTPNYMGFLDEATKQKLNKTFDFSGGYYNDTVNPEASYTGTPTTQQEMEWITNFAKQYNRKPTTLEAANWRQGQGDQNNWDFLPGSSSYERGWRKQGNLNKYSNNEPGAYGPYSGGDIKPGGIVLTDESGKPIKRVYDFNDSTNQGYLARGQFIKPTEEAMLSISPDVKQYMKGGVTDPNVQSQFYPKQNYNLPKYQQSPLNLPDMDTAVKQADQNEIYQYKLRDYLESTYNQDSTLVDKIADLTAKKQKTLDKANTDFQSGTITQNDLDNIKTQWSVLDNQIQGLKGQLSPIMQGHDIYQTDQNGNMVFNADGTYNTADVESIYGDIGNAAQSSLKTQQSGFAADLPLWNEVMSSKGGKNLDRWYQLYGSDYIAKKNAENSQRRQSFQVQVYGPAQQRLQRGYNPMPVSNRSSDFETFLSQNSFAPSVKQWLRVNHDELYMSFQQSGQPDFIDWLIQTLGGG